MNPDCRLVAGAVATLRVVLEAHPDCAIAGPRILNPDGSVQGSARGDPDMLTGLFGRTTMLRRLVPFLPVAKRNVVAEDAIRSGDESVIVDWLSGACMLARRDALNKVHGFDERFFLYWEDADLCRRLRARGHHVRYVPGATAIHRVGQSSRTARTFAIRAFHESAYLYYATCRPGAAQPEARDRARHPEYAVLVSGGRRGSQVATWPSQDNFFDEGRDVFADREARGEPRRFNARSLHQARAFVVSGDEKVRKDRVLGPVQLRADAASPETQIRQLQRRQEPARRLEKGLDRDPVVFVVVLPILVTHRRTEGHIAVDRLAQMGAEAVACAAADTRDRSPARASTARARRTRRGTGRSGTAIPRAPRRPRRRTGRPR